MDWDHSEDYEKSQMFKEFLIVLSSCNGLKKVRHSY